MPVETLRTWERRYGFPKPEPRSNAGHRRYPLAAAERLRLVVRALEAQHAPSVVLRATKEALLELVAVSNGRAPRRPSLRPRAPSVANESFEDRCTRLVLQLDGEHLVAELERAWQEEGGLECLVTRIGPFLNALGTGWSAGDVEIGHEHFASEHVREFLSGHWRPRSARNKGPRVVCATVAGELHVLGLHMAATALALSSARVVFLGANTPVGDVARVAVRKLAQGIALSAALGTDSRLLRRAVKELRQAVPAEVPIVTGGAGFEHACLRVVPGVVPKNGLRELGAWAAELGSALEKPPQAEGRRRRAPFGQA